MITWELVVTETMKMMTMMTRKRKRKRASLLKMERRRKRRKTLMTTQSYDANLLLPLAQVLQVPMRSQTRMRKRWTTSR